MKTSSCHREEEAIRATRIDAVTEDLASHIAGCALCSAAIQTVGWLRQQALSPRFEPAALDASAILWRARLRKGYQERMSRQLEIRRAIDTWNRMVGALLVAALISGVYFLVGAGHAAIADGRISRFDYNLILVILMMVMLSIGGLWSVIRIRSTA